MTETNGAAERAAAMARTHGGLLFRAARAVSLCDDDAHDAVQRALLIYLRRADSVDPSTEVKWLKVVVRHEALAVRRARVSAGEYEVEDLQAREQRTLDEHADASERVSRSTEALAALKQDEARALVAQASGYSYDEISAGFGWSATKTNKAITRGRARFLKTFRRIESGERCEEFVPELAALATGDASTDQVLRLKPHLRGCPSCRATVRELHGARPRSAVAVLVLPVKWILERSQHVAARMAEPMAGLSAGGGRGTAATAVVGICLGGVGAGAYCVERIERHDPPSSSFRPAAPRPAMAQDESAKRGIRVRAGTPPVRRPVRVRTASPAPTPKPKPAPSEEFSPAPSSAVASAARARHEPKPLQTGEASATEFAVAG